MDICPSCGNNFDAWYSKNKGKPQKFPYKTCFQCKQKKAEQQEVPQESNGKQNAALEMIFELREIHRILECIQLNMVQEGKGEIGKPFDAKKNGDIPIVEERGMPIPPGGIPF